VPDVHTRLRYVELWPIISRSSKAGSPVRL